MEFLVREEDKLVKYSCECDIDALDRIRKEIIYKCGVREHKSFETDYINIRNLYIENYQEKIVGKKDYFEETRDIYHIEYDLIRIPRLSTIIDGFIKYEDLDLINYLNGSKELPDELEEYKAYLARKCLEARNELLNSNCSIKRLRDLTDEIEGYEKCTNYLNSFNLIKQSDYLDQIREIIVLKTHGFIDYDSYNYVTSFTKGLKIKNGYKM